MTIRRSHPPGLGAVDASPEAGAAAASTGAAGPLFCAAPGAASAGVAPAGGALEGLLGETPLPSAAVSPAASSAAVFGSEALPGSPAIVLCSGAAAPENPP